jgi:hypothetical protein
MEKLQEASQLGLTSAGLTKLLESRKKYVRHADNVNEADFPY